MPRFKKIYIEITNRCNLQCSFCAVTQRKTRDMTVKEFTGVLKKIRPYTDYIYLHVLGEPLMHPDLLRFMDIAEEGGFQVNLTTNGLLLEEFGDDLLEKGALRQINISLHSMGGHIHQTDQKSYLESSIGFANRAADRFAKIVSLRLWNLGVEEKGTVEYNRMATDYFSAYFNTSISANPGHSGRRGVKLKELIYLNFDDRFAWPVPEAGSEHKAGFCLGLRDQIAVLSDGTVVPCCLDALGDMTLGNLFTEDLPTIIGSRKALAVFIGFTNHQVCEALCRSCSFKERFWRD